MASSSPQRDSLLSHVHSPDSNNHDGTNTSTASPGNARQTRRLQLRNTGFRAAAVPARKITPKAMSSSSWSSVSAVNSTSDIENTSPIATRSSTPVTDTRVSSGVLQEIGNSTLTRRPKKARHRVSSKAFEADAGLQDATHTFSTSPPLPKAGGRRPSAKSKLRHPSVRRRSVSAETSRYIEHLEGELATAQSELSSMTSAGVTKEQNSKMRSLAAESKKMQDSLEEWEVKYEERVQEEVDRHLTMESDLKARIRHLEQDAEDAKFRIQDLETQLETTSQNMQAVETANVSLEKRLEMMGELLASTKVDLHADTPGRAKRHSRPKSMLPRFPTASSLMSSPERQPRTQPTSPLASFTTTGMDMLQSPRHSIIALDNPADHTDFMSEADSVFSEDSATADSMTSTETFEPAANYNPWNLPPRQNSTAKPARRMRRFGAGSLGPKPLILPSTSQCEYFPPASAPPLEHSKTSPTFFPFRREGLREEIPSPITARRRASTLANEFGRRTGAASPFNDISEPALGEGSLVSLTPPPSRGSYATTRRHSSLESFNGRNLMDELSAARSVVTTSSAEQLDLITLEDAKSSQASSEVDSVSGLEAIDPDVMSPAVETIDSVDSIASSDFGSAPTSTVTAGTNHRRSRSRNVSIAASRSDSMLSRIRLLFGDLWRSPIVMARYLIQTAQARMQIPRPLMNVQWWLVGILFGPMAKRHLFSSAARRESANERRLLLDDSGGQPSPSEAGSSPAQSTDGVKHLVKKRGRYKMRCVHHRGKHSPWLWLKFSLTLAFAIGAAFKDGPGSLLKANVCRCKRREVVGSRVSGGELRTLS